MKEKNKEKRIFGLDVLRAIAIILVIINHSSGLLHLHPILAHGKSVAMVQPSKQVAAQAVAQEGTIAGNDIVKKEQPIVASYKRKGKSWALGDLGVELFFVLSGFLIGNILIKQFLTTENFSFGNVMNFWKRRWLRTLPIYWVILTFIIIAAYFIYGIPADTVRMSYYVFLQNLYKPHPTFFQEAWSLAVEEWFYLTVPISLLITSVLFKRTPKSKLLWRVAIGYLLFFTLLRGMNLIDPLYGTDYYVSIRKVVMFRLDAIMYGVVIALFYKYKQDAIVSRKNILMLAGLAGVLITTYFMYYYEVGYIRTGTLPYRVFNILLLYSLLPLFFALILPYANSYKTRNHELNWFEKAVTHISKVSYSMYLVHYAIVYLLVFTHFNATTYPVAVAYYILYWFVVIGLSTVLYHLIEQPILRLRDKLVPDDRK